MEGPLEIELIPAWSMTYQYNTTRKNGTILSREKILFGS